MYWLRLCALQDVEYEEIELPDSGEPVYPWAENKMDLSMVKYYSEAYTIEITIDRPFQNAPKLASVELPEGLTEITVPGTVEKLDYAFLGCENLTSVTLEEGIRKISERVFEDCEKLGDVVYSSSAKIFR